jgi:hypothetical protein
MTDSSRESGQFSFEASEELLCLNFSLHTKVTSKAIVPTNALLDTTSRIAGRVDSWHYYIGESVNIEANHGRQNSYPFDLETSLPSGRVVYLRVIIFLDGNCQRRPWRNRSARFVPSSDCCSAYFDEGNISTHLGLVFTEQNTNGVSLFSKRCFVASRARCKGEADTETAAARAAVKIGRPCILGKSMNLVKGVRVFQGT